MISDMDAKDAATMAKQLEELKEAAYAAKLAQRESDIKAFVAGHKATGAKRMLGLDIFLVFSLGFSIVVFVDFNFLICFSF